MKLLIIMRYCNLSSSSRGESGKEIYVRGSDDKLKKKSMEGGNGVEMEAFFKIFILVPLFVKIINCFIFPSLDEINL